MFTRGSNPKEYVRLPQDLYVGLGAALLTGLMAVFAAQTAIPAWEISIFRTINELPGYLYPVVWVFMQYGVFVTIPIAASIALFFRQRRLAIMMLLGGIAIYFGALVLKSIVDRGRPGDMIPDVILRENFRYLSLGFTSGHAAVAATIAAFAHRYLPRGWQIASLVTLAVVAFGRIYIGGHFPLDVIAGLTMGLSLASLINYIGGVPESQRRIKLIPEQLKSMIHVHRPRHPGDIIRVVLGVLIFGSTTALALSGGISQLEEYLFRLVNYLPSFLSPVLQVVMQMGALYYVFVAAAFALLNKHVRLATKITVGGVGVWILAKIAKELVVRDRPFYLLTGVVERAQNSGILGFPSGHASVAALIATVATPYMTKNWSRVFWFGTWLVAVSRIYVGAHLPLDIFAGMAIGWTTGSILNLIFGTPEKPLPMQRIRQVLADAGYRVKRIVTADVDARGSSPLIVETSDHQKIFVKAVSNEHKNADILFKLWRYFTLREVEDEAPFTTAKQLLEHEAYMYALTGQAGVRTPRVRLATPVTSTTAILATDMIQGRTLDHYEGQLTAKMLADIWIEIDKLQQARIAHRDLRSANILIDDRQKPWLIDFSFAETASSARRLAVDLVESMASLSLLAEPRLVVESMVKGLGKKRVGHTLPYLQMGMLSSSTRHAYHGRQALLEELRREVETQTQARGEPVQVKRFGYHTVVWLALGLGLMYFFITQAGHRHDYAAAFHSYNVGWLLLAFLASIVTYVMSALVLHGASILPLAYGRTLILQSATSFINRVTPKGIGGAAVTEQYLEHNGLNRAQAMAATSLTYVSGIFIHLLLTAILIFGLASHPVSIDLPEGWSMTIAVVAGLALIGIGMLSRLKKAIRSYLREGAEAVKHIFSNPIKAFQLLGGSLGVTLAYTISLYFSAHAFGISLPFEQVLLVYLAGSVIASAAPTPGGLGAAEASLAGGFIALGVSPGPAVAAVLAFRVLTFWLPILPGLFSLRYLRRQHLL